MSSCTTPTVGTWFSFAWAPLGESVSSPPLPLGSGSLKIGLFQTALFLHALMFCLPGLAPGTVVVSEKALDYNFLPQFEQVVLGKVIMRSTELDAGVSRELLQCSKELPNLPAVIGNTMCTNDFYEGESRASYHQGPYGLRWDVYSTSFESN